eukprot:CAMPEP_0119060440 /NCGR_PEP_ID=MMETSP1178-20130426/4396_1 /TAXON_ID=33656 /ORGANISM="unid sp, Strain CCMP2000" /LENGTH=126 /DNA_ID=CAMNT_0007041539 /DNA_START=69 /DNA_END=450 /DNA_ORIENTATION=-
MGKGKKAQLATEPDELKHLEVCVNDIIKTPLGVSATVVGLDTESQVLMLKWPGGLESPMPGPCSSKEDMEAMGYDEDHKVTISREALTCVPQWHLSISSIMDQSGLATAAMQPLNLIDTYVDERRP